MSKHTPGPWKVDGNRVYTLNNRGVNHLDVQVFVGNGWAPHKDEQDADAALIVAAPDMLAALRRLFRACGHLPIEATPESAEVMMAGLEAVRAIKKATGEDP